MSNFWIQISESGMPQAVQKVEFMPTIGWNWENFGKRGELKAKDAEIERMRKALEEISSTGCLFVIQYGSNESPYCNCIVCKARKALEGK